MISVPNYVDQNCMTQNCQHEPVNEYNGDPARIEHIELRLYSTVCSRKGN